MSIVRQWQLLGPERLELGDVEVLQPIGRGLTLDVHSALTCGTDVKAWRRGGHPTMLQCPSPFGHEVSGTVSALGPDQSEFAVGQRVVLANSSPCGDCLECRRQRENLCQNLEYFNGAFADRVAVTERFASSSLYAVPDRVDLALAPLAEPFACVLHCIEALRRSSEPLLEGVANDTRAVVLGCGPLGLLLCSELATLGVDVIAVDPHPHRLAVARELGAADVRTGRGPALSPNADLVIDATGTEAGWSASLASLRPGGTAVFFGGPPAGLSLAADGHALHYGELTLMGSYHYRPADFRSALRKLEAYGLPYARLIDDVQPLEGLPEALAAMAARRIFKARLDPRA